MWVYKGSPHFLDKQAARFKADLMLAHVSRHNVEIYKAQTLMAQLEDRARKARRENGKPVFGKPERDGIKGTLDMVERLRTRLYMLAASVEAMLDEGYVELDVEPPKRTYEILCEYDTPPPPLPRGDELCGLAAELEPSTVESE
jgi:hypothetical protein